ncbi:hypothetical protein GCM10010304_64720 [Streptomyces roseoviolaceus]
MRAAVGTFALISVDNCFSECIVPPAQGAAPTDWLDRKYILGSGSWAVPASRGRCPRSNDKMTASDGGSACYVTVCD